MNTSLTWPCYALQIYSLANKDTASKVFMQQQISKCDITERLRLYPCAKWCAEIAMYIRRLEKYVPNNTIVVLLLSNLGRGRFHSNAIAQLAHVL